MNGRRARACRRAIYRDGLSPRFRRYGLARHFYARGKLHFAQGGDFIVDLLRVAYRNLKRGKVLPR